MHFKIKVINNNHSCDNDWRKGTGQCKFITIPWGNLGQGTSDSSSEPGEQAKCF